jgi:fructan beta-fructosidase
MNRAREMMVRSRYIHLPVKNGAPVVTLRLVVDGETVRRFDLELADAEPDFWVFSDVSAFAGQLLVIEADGVDSCSPALAMLSGSDSIRDAETLYAEKYRPQFHFSSRRGWNNDPNGLVYYAGEYHLFYQHNPYGVKWGNMHWGHAVSTDLMHWREMGDALYPDHLGTCFSGSAVVDMYNTAGFQTGDDKALVCIYTSAGEPFTQSIAYSNDRGRTWTKYRDNPVLGHMAGRNRDPKVVWHATTRQWVMALYLEENDYALLSSPNLKEWTRLGDIELPDCTECPDFFALPVEGDPGDIRWVFWGANGTYVLGSFDGVTFEQDSEVQRYDWGGDTYAAQTWSDIPAEDGRRIQIAWLRVDPPGMPFSQQMTFPCELTLRRTPDGVRLFSQPVREIEGIRAKKHCWRAQTLEPGGSRAFGVTGDTCEIRAEFTPAGAAALGLTVLGSSIVYNVGDQELSFEGRVAPLRMTQGRIRLRLLVDRVSMELFGNDGEVALTVGVIRPQDSGPLEAFSRGGCARMDLLELYELRSTWR